MARKIVHQDACDRHELLGLGEFPADGSIRISLNGGPEQEYDLCNVCIVALQPVIELYAVPGRRPDEAERKEAARKKRQKQIEPPPAEEPDKPLGIAVTKYPTSTKRENLHLPHVVCPEDHPQEGGPIAIRYPSRGQHARDVHNKELWGIKWEDPDGILTVPCQKHVVCKETGLAFTSAQGRAQHYLRNTSAE